MSVQNLMWQRGHVRKFPKLHDVDGNLDTGNNFNSSIDNFWVNNATTTVMRLIQSLAREQEVLTSPATNTLLGDGFAEIACNPPSA